MWLNLLIILLTCIAVAVLGFVFWNIIQIKKTLMANQSKSWKGKNQTQLSTDKDIKDRSLEQSLNEADYAPDIQSETGTETEDDWQNNEVSQASASTLKKEDDDWLNAGVEEALTNTYKQQDDDWLNAGNTQPLKNMDESWLNSATANRPEIQIKQDGSILDINVTTSKKQDTKSEQTVINLKINLPPRYLARKGDGPYDIEITTDDSSPFYQSLSDFITTKPVEEAISQYHPPMDDISIRSLENRVTANLALMDEITVRPVESPVLTRPQLMDEVHIRPVENQVTASLALMDEISIKPSPGPVNIEYELLDDLITKSAIYLTKKAKLPSDAVITNGLEKLIEKEEPVDTVSINEITEILKEKGEITPIAIPSESAESPSPSFLARMVAGINSIFKKAEPSSHRVMTNSAEISVEKVELSSKVVLTNPAVSPVEKVEPVKAASVNEIAKIPEEKKDIKPVAIPSVAAELPSTASLPHIGQGMGNLLNQAKNLFKKAKLPGPVAVALATLHFYNKNEFFIQETTLTDADTCIQKPQIKDFTFKVIKTAAELDQLIRGGYDLVMNFSQIKHGLKKGLVAFLTFSDRELASMGWACLSKDSKATFKAYPYNDDLDRKACIVGDWTNPKFRDSDISNYVKCQRQQLLKEKGFTSERSLVEKSQLKDLSSMNEQKGFDSTYKRRTYTNVSVPGILGVEFWKEHPLNETNSKPLYQMITLLILVLPFPPKVAHVSIKPKV